MNGVPIGMTNEQWQHQIMQQAIILRSIYEMNDMDSLKKKLGNYIERLEDTLKKP